MRKTEVSARERLAAEEQMTVLANVFGEPVRPISEFKDDVAAALGQLLNFITAVALTVRMNSSYGSDRPQPGEREQNCMLSDILHNLNEIGSALTQGNWAEAGERAREHQQTFDDYADRMDNPADVSWEIKALRATEIDMRLGVKIFKRIADLAGASQ